MNIKKYVNLYKSFLGQRDKNIWLFGSWFGEKIADNPKYLYLYCLNCGINAVWITKNTNVYDFLKSNNYPVEMADSEKGIALCKTAKFYITCTSLNDICDEYSGGAVLVNLWHGIPVKKIVYDDKYDSWRNTKKEKLQRMIRKLPDSKSYVCSTSETISNIYLSAFKLSKSHIIQIGQVRNDCFFDGSMKHRTYANIPYKHLISYLPTHRNEGKTKIEDHVIFDLAKLEGFCKKNDCLFLIKKHFYHNKENSDLSAYPHIIDLTTRNDIDTQELMYNTDVLITDYSSCYIDYLLLDRPIVFYCFDYEHYLKADREMYFNYDDVTPGAHARNFDELLPALQHALDGNERYKDRQEQVKNLFYSKENQGIVAPRLVEAIKKL